MKNILAEIQAYYFDSSSSSNSFLSKYLLQKSSAIHLLSSNTPFHGFYVASESRLLERFLLTGQCQANPLSVTTPRDSNAWNRARLETLPTPCGSLAEGGFEPLTIGSMLRNLTTESYPETNDTLIYLCFAAKPR